MGEKNIMAWFKGDPDPAWDASQERAERAAEARRQEAERKRIKTPKEIREIEEREQKQTLAELNDVLHGLDTSHLTSKGGELPIPIHLGDVEFEVVFIKEWFRKHGWDASISEYESLPPKRVVSLTPYE